MTYRHVRRPRPAPFALWDFRAGMSFAALDSQALREAKQRFTCHQVLPSARVCELHATGINGRLRVLVDARDRAAWIAFRPDSASPVMREEGRRIAAEWNRLRAGVQDEPRADAPNASTTRWISKDGHWSASMSYDRLATTPAMVQLGDEQALDTVRTQAPLAAEVLALNEVGTGRRDGAQFNQELENALASQMLGRPTDPALETPAPRAAPDVAPLCEGVPDIVLQEGTIPRWMDSAIVADVRQAIPMAYPGARLVTGSELWMAGSTGGNMRMRLGPRDAVDDVSVYAIWFPTRADMAQQRLRDRDPYAYCRAPAAILFMQRGPNGTVAEAHRIAVDDEAMASEITRLTIEPPDVTGGAGRVRVRFTAVHATDAWTGTIEWEGVVAGDPPRAVARVPLAFSLQPTGADDAVTGTLVLTARRKEGIEISTLEQHDWGAATRTFVVPLDADGALSGSRILTHLAQP